MSFKWQLCTHHKYTSSSSHVFLSCTLLCSAGVRMWYVVGAQFFFHWKLRAQTSCISVAERMLISHITLQVSLCSYFFRSENRNPRMWAALLPNIIFSTKLSVIAKLANFMSLRVDWCVPSTSWSIDGNNQTRLYLRTETHVRFDYSHSKR